MRIAMYITARNTMAPQQAYLLADNARTTHMYLHTFPYKCACSYIFPIAMVSCDVKNSYC